VAIDISERAFEAAIEADLLALDYRKRKPRDYDRALCLDPELLLEFIAATQAERWAKLEQTAGKEARQRFLSRVASEIGKRGTSEALHGGVKVAGVKFDLAYFKPAMGIDEQLVSAYRANVFSIVRQLRYGVRAGERSKELDWVVFLNGLPLVAAELKDHFTGQSVRDAVAQWRTERDHREPLFELGRLVAFLAVDDEVVQVATHLQGEGTRFLPFNRGKNGGAGNPPTSGYATEYLWKEVLAPDSVLDLLQHFVFMVEVEREGAPTGEHEVLFPRYHQLTAVRRAVDHVREHGGGHNYLFQHSAGAGKSNTIAWLGNHLSLLHDEDDEPAFDSVIVLTDRKVLDRQLQSTLRRLQRTTGVLENIEKTSKELREALESGKRIIVSTIQKFPVIQNHVSELPGRRFAVLIDEAHGSQSGEASAAVKEVLDAGSLAEAEELEAKAEEKDLEDEVVESMRKRGRLGNLSTFAFTATPKKETLELFGAKRADGTYAPFSLYSRRQAIEEGFIVDILENYVTYDSYWKLMKKVDDDPKYERRKAQALLKSFVEVHPHMVKEKVRIAVEVFEAQSREKIGGRAKAMYVCGSRLHAVRTKLAMDAYLRERGLPWKALVAFSGTVRDGGKAYTEPNMNGIPESQTAETFKADEYRFLIVANKFQTGFDQPLLQMMAVDKKLNATNVVQTLERLNRTHPEKRDTLILDFVNEPLAVQKAFATYHQGTVLTEPTDPDLVHDLEAEITGSGLYEQEDVDEFARVWFGRESVQADLHPVLAPTVERYEEADEDERAGFRGALAAYTRLYGFLSGVVEFADPELEKLYLWARLLLTKLPTPEGGLPLDVQTDIELESMKVRRRGRQRIELAGEPPGEVTPVAAPAAGAAGTEDLAPLSQIIEELNDHFGVELGEDDRVSILRLEEKLDEDAGLEKTMRVNDPEDAKLSFDQIAEREFDEIMKSNSKLYKLVMNDELLRARLFARLYDRFVERHDKPE
jgi:type I restriction enzyme, R subunit